MSVATPAFRVHQDQAHAFLSATFPSYRLELDRMGESVLWLPEPAGLVALVLQLRSEPTLRLDRLSDLTAYDNIDGIDGPKRFILVYQLYSMSLHVRLRLKIAVDESEAAPSLTAVWNAANWLEREVYDMFGLRFAGHPDLRRILMDERFVGYPLRKEYDLEDRQPFPDSLPVRIANSQARAEDKKL